MDGGSIPPGSTKLRNLTPPRAGFFLPVVREIPQKQGLLTCLQCFRRCHWVMARITASR
jgi:hypothetical protein